MDCTDRIIVSWITCFLTAFCAISVTRASVPPPENVRVTSVNMDVVLEWDPPPHSPGNLTYTAGYSPGYSSVRGPTIVCQNQSERSCDFTDDLSNFGIYKFLVWAEFQTETSDWMSTSEFSKDKDTLIGAPTVRLSSKSGNLEVDIQEPVMRNSWYLRKVYGHLCFNVRYWKESEMGNVTVLNCEPQTNLVLSSELEPRTRYCVQAQVYVPSHEKTSDFSQIMCETISDGRAPPWLIVTVMVCSLVGVAGIVLLIFFFGWYGYKGMKVLFPKVKLPEHIKQYLIEPPHSYIFLAMQNSSLPEEKCHEVCILSALREGTEAGEGTPR